MKNEIQNLKPLQTIRTTENYIIRAFDNAGNIDRSTEAASKADAIEKVRLIRNKYPKHDVVCTRKMVMERRCNF